jgi:hypothetical protein
VSRHTPGPWRVGKRIFGDRGARFVDVSGRDLCETSCGKHCPKDGEWLVARLYLTAVPKEQHIANARLIAAAPEMLSALKALMDGDGEVHDRVIAARAAIAKAEGR